MAPEPASRSVHLLPFGIPTLIIADDPQLLAAAAAAYAHWLAEAPFPDAALELRLEIGRASSFDVSFGITVEGSRLRVAGAGFEGQADAARGLAHATLAVGLIDDRATLSELTDTLLLFMLARRDRTPVHASAFVLGSAAVVLAGPSGSGKSTLALAAAQRGLPLLSDDTIFVQRTPSFAVWGFPRAIHVYPADGPAGDHPTRLRNRKLKAAVPIARPALKTEEALLIVIDRGRELGLREISADDAVDRLMRLDPGFDLLERESRAALEDLSSRGVWRLSLIDHPAAAIELLVEHFDR